MDAVGKQIKDPQFPITVANGRSRHFHRRYLRRMADSFYSDEHIVMLEKRIADLKAGRNMHEHDLVEVK